MKIYNHHFVKNQDGTQEIEDNQLTTKSPPHHHYNIFCDVLTLEEPLPPKEKEHYQVLFSNKIKEWISYFLENSSFETINENTISEAFAYANQQLLQADAICPEKIAISALLLFHCNDSNQSSDEIIIAGVGDFQFYQILENDVSLLFHDSNQELPQSNQSKVERLNSLQNALGASDSVQVTCTKIPLSSDSQYILMSYGCYEQVKVTDFNKLYNTDSSETENLITEFLQSRPLKEHALIIHSFLFKESSTHSQPLPSQPQKQTKTKTEKKRYKKRKITAFVAAATLALTSLFSLLMNDNQVAPENDMPSLYNRQEALIFSENQLNNVEGEGETNTLLNTNTAQTIFANNNHTSFEPLSNQVTQQLEVQEEQISQEQPLLEQGTPVISEYFMDQLAEQIEDQQGEIEQVQSLLQEKEAMIAELTEKLQTNKEKSSNHLLIDQEKAQKDKKELLTTINQLNLQNAKLLEANNKASTTFAALKQENNSLLVQIGDQEIKQEQLAQHFSDNELLKEQIYNLENSLSEVNHSYELLEFNLAKLQKQKKNDNTQKKQLITSLETHIKELESSFLQKEKAKAYLDQNLSETTNQLNKILQSNEALTVENNTLQEKETLLQEENKRLQNFEELYNKEHLQRIAQEKLFEELKVDLFQEFENVTLLESSRNALFSELQKIKHEYADLSQKFLTSSNELHSLKQMNSQELKSDQPVHLFTSTTKREGRAVEKDVKRSKELITIQEESKQLTSSTSSGAATTLATHTVKKGDSLSKISKQYYNSSRYWKDIYNANKKVIANQNNIKEGITLVIPKIQ